MDIEGLPVTADAMSCQKTMADTCIEQGADYLLAVKGNQPMMQGEIEKHLESRKAKVYKKPSIDFLRPKKKVVIAMKYDVAG